MFVLGLALTLALAPDALHYTLRPVPTTDRTELHVSLDFTRPTPDSLTAFLPVDFYSGLPLEQHLTQFEGRNGTTVRPGSAPAERVVTPGPDGKISLDYTLAYDPALFGHVSFGPNIAPDYFHVAGCQWLLRVGNSAQIDHYVIDFADAPAGWSLYSSLALDPRHIELDASYDALGTATFGGGAAPLHRFEIDGSPVLVSVQGQFQIGRQRIFELAETIVRQQRAVFDDDSDPFYVVAITPREDNVCGTQVPRCFIGFAKTDATHLELAKLLAHEMFHTWLPGKIDVRAPRGVDSEYRYMWYAEGFTDLLARLLLLRAKLITEQEFVDLVNNDIVTLADNPYRAATSDDALAASRANTFGQTFRKLSYSKGALMALNWNAAIQAKTPEKSLLDFVKECFEEAAPAGVLPEADFFEIAARYGVDAQHDVDEFVTRGRPVVVSGSPLPGYAFEPVTAPEFDPGFELEKSRASGVVSGVRAGGPAHAAGLRDGMKIVRTKNTNRFANVWFADRPMEITVSVDGSEKTISFAPAGAPRTLQLLRPVGAEKR